VKQQLAAPQALHDDPELPPEVDELEECVADALVEEVVEEETETDSEPVVVVIGTCGDPAGQ